MNDPDIKLLLLLLLGAGAAGTAWYFWDDLVPPTGEPALQHSAPLVDKSEPGGPRHPVDVPSISAASNVDLVALPRLDESDDYFLLAMADLLGPDIGGLLVREALIDKFVATIDNLPRKHVSEKIRPVGRLTGSFTVTATTDAGPYYLSEANYGRYANLLSLVNLADLGEAEGMYRRFYPLLQESYVRLGYPNGYFNDRVIEVIDHLLDTPVPVEPIELVQPHVLYEFADPELEDLSSGQKLLLRMGNEHAAHAKSLLRELRSRLATSQ